MPKITKRLIDATTPGDKDIFIRDSAINGFICKITPKGRKVYMLYYRTNEGRERRPAIGTHGNITCDEARQKALIWCAEIAKGNDPSLNKKLEKTYLTISDLALRYIEEHALIHKKAASAKKDQSSLRNYILPTIGKIGIKSLTSKDIYKLHYSLRQTPITANRCLALLSKMLNLSEKWGIRADASSLCRHIKKYPENKRERFLSNSEIEKLFAVLKEAEHNKTELPSAIAAIRLLLLTGCRFSEIITLKWEYLDIPSFRINFPDSKTGKKTTYISPYVAEILSHIKQQPNNPYVICGTIEGKHLVNLCKPWYRIRKLAGLSEVRLHDLRHSFASIAAADGLSLPIIGALLGHSQVSTTARYAHLVGEPLQKAANSIGDRIKAMTKQGQS
jgi:integrase